MILFFRDFISGFFEITIDTDIAASLSISSGVGAIDSQAMGLALGAPAKLGLHFFIHV